MSFRPVGKYELLFGKGGLLQERRLLDEEGKKGARYWVVREITRLSDYRPHELPQGEPTWFPHQAVVGYYVGQLPDGTLVEWQTESLRIKDLRFNVDIPDEKFTLDFPREARVFDGLTGQEAWLEPGVRPASVFYPESQGRRRLLWIVGTSLIGVTLLGAVILYFRRKRRSGPATG
jgi:hypothetical protein